MAPIQVRLRNAIGLLKDQTSISIAKVASSGTPDLEVAIVKATSHEEVPSEERYVQVVLHRTSFSRAYVNACVCNIARRLSKTCNWVVAIKALILSHRLLRDGDAAFGKELMLSRRQGMRVLNVSDFRDESHLNGWDFSAFVHAYGFYLDSRLDCSSWGSFGARPKPDRRASHKDSSFEYSDSVHHSDEYGSYDNDTEMKHPEKEKSSSLKDMKMHQLIEILPAFQRLLGRVLACKPTGPAKANRLVSVALYAVIRESFVIYADLQDGLAVLHDSFFDMDLEDCGRVLEIFVRAAKQMDQLMSFYSFCKALGVCKTAEYPSVHVISKDLLVEMEDFISDDSRFNQRRKSPEPMPESPQKETKGDNTDVNVLPVLAKESPAPVPAPEVGTVNPATEAISNVSTILVDLEEPTTSSEEFGDKLSLALFSGSQTKVNAKWEAFPEHSIRGSTMATASSGVTGWELALIESESELSKPNGNSLAGGFDHLLLESLYEHGADLQSNLLARGPAGSASSVVSASSLEPNFFALPAPVSGAPSYSNDPFSASKSVPSPAYIQMSEMQQKQQLLIEEQQQWLHYQQGGMQGYVGLMKYPTNPFVSPFQPTPYPVAYHSSNPYYS
ncbi:hypothetical protein L7F22_049706 [Adiantum nelumboides]|nr:hypothetical protein [Adiantum nelumboides]